MISYRKGSTYFTLLILAYFALIGFLSFDYDEKTRLVPLLIVMAGLILTIFCLIAEFFPKLAARVDISLISLGQTRVETGASRTRGGELVGRRGLLITTGWLIGFFVLVLLVGFLIGLPIAVFLFLKVFVGQGWLKSLALTIATWAFIYVVFDFLVEFELFRGILFGEIVLI